MEGRFPHKRVMLMAATVTAPPRAAAARAHALHLQCWVACELVALAVRMPFPCAPVRGAAGVAAPSSTVSAGRAAAAAPQRTVTTESSSSRAELQGSRHDIAGTSAHISGQSLYI